MSSDTESTGNVESTHDDDRLTTVVDSLARKFPDVPESVITEYVDEAHAPMIGAPIQEYVPVLAEHQAQVRLNEHTSGNGVDAD
jgi:hypothetical protein